MKRWCLLCLGGVLGLGSCLSAADESTILGRTDIERLVYASHLSVAMDQHPELDAAVLSLIALHQRNPGVNSAALAGTVRQALLAYRHDNADANSGLLARRDEILAAFLSALVVVPGHAGLRPATLGLLESLVEDGFTATTGSGNVRIHSANQQTLSAEHALAKRQALIDAAVARAHADASFADGLDALLLSETGVSVRASPSEVLLHSPLLTNSPTLQWLAERYNASMSDEIEISSSSVESLFTAEMVLLRSTISANQSLHKELESSQGDLASYLGDPARVAEFTAYQQQAREQHDGRIATASAAAHALSFVASRSKPDLAGQMQTVANSMSMVARGMAAWDSARKLSQLAACGNFVSAGLGVVSLFLDTGPSPEEMILEEIDALKQMIQDLATHLDYRFDRVDRTLAVVLEQLNEGIQMLGEIGHDVDEVRLDLLDVQTSLSRLERELYAYLNAGFRRDFVERINGDLQYEARTGEPMAWSWYRDVPENTFYSWAVSHSKDALSSYVPESAYTYPASDLQQQINSRPLESSLNYLNGYLEHRLGVPPLSTKPVANPRDWFAGADAYLRLAVENPLHFRRMSRARIDEVIQVGQELETFLGAITLAATPQGPQVNAPLFDALLGQYADTLGGFLDAVRVEENAYAAENHFAHKVWRAWESRASATWVDESMLHGRFTVIRPPADVVRIEAGADFVIMLRSDGRVLAWGDNGNGQCEVVAGLTEVMDIKAGSAHCLALRANGEVVAWGFNAYGQCAVPPGLTNAIAIDAGAHHSLALRADGTVVAWGYGTQGAGKVPDGLTNVVALAAGGDPNRDFGAHNLVLKADGSVFAWGDNQLGECDVPEALAAGQLEVVGIAAGDQWNVVVLGDGSIMSWPFPITSSAPLAQVSLSHNSSALALRRDGTVEVLRGASVDGMPMSNDIIQVSTGEFGNNAALHADGAITIWGGNSNADGTHGREPGPMVVGISGTSASLLMLYDDGTVRAAPGDNTPIDIPPARAIAAGCGHGENFGLALLEDGTVRAWGGNALGQCNVPEGLTNVVAIAAGDGTWHGAHSLALQRNGKVVAWGYNGFGECEVPADLTMAVAIAAGWRHSAALQADGRVRVWGSNWYGEHNVPAGLEDVVAISSRHSHILALRADGSVLAWGLNDQGQCDVPAGLTNVVAIDAGVTRSLALRADGSVVAWGENRFGACDYANVMTGVLMLTGGDWLRDHFLIEPESPSVPGGEPFAFNRQPLATPAVSEKFRELYARVIQEFDYDLHDPALQMTAARALIESVIALGLPTSLEQDDALRGFLFGVEPMADKEIARALYQSEWASLGSSPSARPRDLEAILRRRFDIFTDRLGQRLDEIAAKAKPEAPRMITHTLRLLRLLRSAHGLGVSPAPVLELIHAHVPANSIAFSLHGEPFIHYQLDRSVDLSNWSATGIDLLDGESWTATIPQGGQSLFYRAVLPGAP